jgi:carboxyl-terminal processing protease
LIKKITQSIILSGLLLSNTIAGTIAEKEVEKTKEETQMERFEAMAKLTNVLAIVEKLHVDEMKMNEIVNKTIKGLLSELDSHSSYLDKKAYKEMNEKTKGEFGGLGFVVGMKQNALTVISPIDDTPAQRAGIKSGDIIVKIDDETTLEMTLNEAVNLMRGKPGTDTTLTIVRKGENKPLKIDITRDIIKVKSVKTKQTSVEGLEGILYIRVSSFDENVVERMSKAIKEQKDLKGIVLDLRNNPGGLLNQAVGVVDLFVDKGVIVSQKGREEESKEEHLATKGNTLTDVPVVVLVNGGSASASEIVSGALQDFKRAIVVGEETFGKGSVQIVLPITREMDEALKLTIAQYYLPSGRTIQAKGVQPDIQAYTGETPKKEENDFEIKEKDLKKHLENELDKTEDKKKKEEKEKKEEEKKKIISSEDLQKDYQLSTGYNILKSMILLEKK